jgi:Methyltransferase domain
MSGELLNEVEVDFLEFLSIRESKEFDYLKKIYLETKEKYNFSTPDFKKLTLSIYEVNKILHDEVTEEELLKTYKFHELISIYRFLSYTYETKQPASVSKKVKTAVRLVLSGNFRVATRMLSRSAHLSKQQKSKKWSEEPKTFRGLAEYLLKHTTKPVSRVVDYGCGPAYVSFEIAKIHKEKNLPIPTVCLVDLDWITKEFVIFRFKKYGFPVESIEVSKTNLYPTLPPHDICIASEVMEHIKDPVLAFTNINASLADKGVMYGNYNDHTHHMLHISPNLSNLRKELSLHQYRQVSPLTFVKGG